MKFGLLLKIPFWCNQMWYGYIKTVFLLFFPSEVCWIFLSLSTHILGDCCWLIDGFSVTQLIHFIQFEPVCFYFASRNLHFLFAHISLVNFTGFLHCNVHVGNNAEHTQHSSTISYLYMGTIRRIMFTISP